MACSFTVSMGVLGRRLGGPLLICLEPDHASATPFPLTVLVLAGLAALHSGCAVPEQDPNAKAQASSPRDCAPQTGTRVPASCTRPKGTASTRAGTVQTMERPTRLEITR